MMMVIIMMMKVCYEFPFNVSGTNKVKKKKKARRNGLDIKAE